MNEEYKYNIIKKLVDSNGNKKNAELKLNCSRRTINRLINKYKTFGKQGFIHGNTGKVPINKIDDTLKSDIVSLYLNKYYDANFIHFKELLLKFEGIDISDTTINTIMREHDILSPKAFRKTRKSHKKLLKAKLKEATNQKEKNIIENNIYLIDQNEAHPRRPRCANFGELIQMDASEHEWFGGFKSHLHLAIDDATGKIVGAYFDSQETLKGYYNVFYQILMEYGIPYKFLTDRRTVFEYKRKNAPSDHEDTFTQFSYACHQLGVEIDTTSIPQAKGRVERLNQTIQSRLVVELRIHCINTIEKANQFLKNYLIEFNEKFSLPISKSKSVFENSPSEDKINLTLAIISKRILDQGHCIKYKNKYYIPTTSNQKKIYYNPGMQVLVIEAFDKNKYMNINDNIYSMTIVEDRLENSAEFDEVKEEKKRKVYIPPLTHPWKQASYNAYLAKQKHRHEFGAYV